jgi:hypothetical protein
MLAVLLGYKNSAAERLLVSSYHKESIHRQLRSRRRWLSGGFIRRPLSDQITDTRLSLSVPP